MSTIQFNCRHIKLSLKHWVWHLADSIFNVSESEDFIVFELEGGAELTFETWLKKPHLEQAHQSDVINLIKDIKCLKKEKVFEKPVLFSVLESLNL